MKNIIIAVIVIVFVGFAWFASTRFIPHQVTPVYTGAVMPIVHNNSTATGTQEITPAATSSAPIVKKKPTGEVKPKEPARIALTKTLFPYTITIGKTPCGDKIGSFDVVSTDPSKELYWGMTGAMPIWLTFSSVEGKTPTTVDMSFNCIMSGAEEKINWGFVVVEKTKEGKYVDGYYRNFKIEGDIKKE